MFQDWWSSGLWRNRKANSRSKKAGMSGQVAPCAGKKILWNSHFGWRTHVAGFGRGHACCKSVVTIFNLFCFFFPYGLFRSSQEEKQVAVPHPRRCLGRSTLHRKVSKVQRKHDRLQHHRKWNKKDKLGGVHRQKDNTCRFSTLFSWSQ